MITPKELKARYAKGENISALLREAHNVEGNTREIIEISYEMQAGSYIQAMRDPLTAKHKAEYSRAIAEVISSICQPASVLEAGIGEATTLSGVVGHLGHEVRSYGFDLSWSRLAYAKMWLVENGVSDTVLCSGDLLNIPFLDSSVDVVYTSHSIEPNGGNEKKILRELYRVARKFLVLLEPAYELADNRAKKRMDSHGYCKNLEQTARDLGYSVLRHELFSFSSNPLNPTALTVISKRDSTEILTDVLACPKFKTPIRRIGNAMYSPEALVAYPILDGIPCLRLENGIFAGEYQKISESKLYPE